MLTHDILLHTKCISNVSHICFTFKIYEEVHQERIAAHFVHVEQHNLKHLMRLHIDFEGEPDVHSARSRAKYQVSSFKVHTRQTWNVRCVLV